MPVTDVIRARNDHDAKERAAAAMADMGLSISDAIRLLMVGAGEHRLPSETKAVNAVARKAAAAELESSQAKAFADFADLMAGLRNRGD